MVPIGDARALAEAIIGIMSQPEKYKGSPEDIQNTFDPMVNAAAYETIYNELRGDLS